MLMLPAARNASITGVVVGLLLGSAQWLALRRAIPSAGWWIIASGLGWLLGIGLGAALAAQLSTVGALLVTGVVDGVITGFSMQQLVQPEKVVREAWQEG